MTQKVSHETSESEPPQIFCCDCKIEMDVIYGPVDSSLVWWLKCWFCTGCQKVEGAIGRERKFFRCMEIAENSVLKSTL